MSTRQTNKMDNQQSGFQDASQKYAYKDGWKVVSVKTIPNIEDLSTKQIAPSGLKYIVHYAKFCTVILNCNPEWEVTSPEEVNQ